MQLVSNIASNDPTLHSTDFMVLLSAICLNKNAKKSSHDQLNQKVPPPPEISVKFPLPSFDFSLTKNPLDVFLFTPRSSHYLMAHGIHCIFINPHTNLHYLKQPVTRQSQ